MRLLFYHLPVRMHLGFAVSKWIGIWYRTVPMQAQGSASYSWQSDRNGDLLCVAFNEFACWRVATSPLLIIHKERK